MYRPRQFQLQPDDISAMQRNGTLHRDLAIAEWMEQSHPYGDMEHRQSAVRWARRALHPGAAVILGIETTTPEAGALIEIAIIETDTTIRMNSLVKPWAPINPITQRHQYLTDEMVAGAPSFRQLLTDLITVTAGRMILTYNSGAFDTVVRESQRAGLDSEHLEEPAQWRSIAQTRSNWLGHPDHYLPIPPTPRALGQCHAALHVLKDIATDSTNP